MPPLIRNMGTFTKCPDGYIHSYNCVSMKWFTTGSTSVDPFSNCSKFIFVGVHYTA